MATPVISPATAVDSLPPLTIGDKKPDKGAARLGQATKSSKALTEATADQHDTSDSDDQALQGEKEAEVQAGTKDKPQPLPRPLPLPRPQPQPGLQSPAAGAAPDAAPNGSEPLVPAGFGPAASEERGTMGTMTKGTDAKKQKKDAGAVASSKPGAKSETAAADAGLQKSRLPFRRNNNAPRNGGKQKEKGGLGTAWQKLKMGLFNKKKKEPVEENPYANPITPYQQARNDLANGVQPGVPGGLPSNPRMNSFGSGSAPPPYQSPSVASNGPRFGDEKYGNQNGYGSNRYDNNNAPAPSARRPGGYGGFGDEGGNNDLFGGAAGRYVPPQQGSNGSPANNPASSQPPQGRYDNDSSRGALLGNAQDRYNPLPPASRQEAPAGDDEYGGYGAPRELTEEEREREEVRATQAETRAVRKEGVASLARSRQIGQQALATAAGTAARIGEQGARLQRTERNLDAALVKTRESERSTKELNRINGSMFSGFTGPSRRTRDKMDDEVHKQYQIDRKTREDTAKSGYQAEQQMEGMFKDLSGNKPRGPLGAKNRAADRSKYVFDDSDEELAREDQRDEDEIDEGIDELRGVVGQLKNFAVDMGDTLTEQNQRLDRLQEKTTNVDDRVALNRQKLSRIR